MVRVVAQVILAVALTGSLSLGQQTKLQAIECPFPEGQDVASEAKCAEYTACEWTDGRCHMVSNDVGGYVVDGEAQDTGRGFKVNLKKADASKTMFGADVADLVFEVIQHENYHVQIKIYDPVNARYEVPLPLNLPAEAEADPLYSVSVSGNGEPFHFNVNRNTNGNTLFRSEGPLTFEDQFIQLHTGLMSSYLYGFGENTHTSFRQVFEPRTTFPIFARDQPVGTEPMNEYGHHPYYMVMEDDFGNSHSVLLHNSNAMEYSTFLLDDGTPTLTLRTIGGIIDLHFFLGPDPEDLNLQYTNMVGTPAMPTYWSLGFHLSRWGYNSTDGVRAARERMKVMGIPQTCDIDYMDRQRDFTYDPVNWGDMPDLINELHNDNIKVTLILDPALVIDFDYYAPAARGKDSDVFIKWSDPSFVPSDQEAGTDDYMVGYVWPDTKTIFPDFLKPETATWWTNELKLFHDALQYDAIWIDMNEPANFGTNLDKPWNWPEGKDPWSLKCPENKWDSPPYPTMMIRVGDNQSKKISDHTICMSGNQTDGTKTYLHYDVHSLYGLTETIATFNGLTEVFPNKRPVVLSRSTFPGSGKYAVHWLGDNAADWTQMHMSIIGMFDFNMFGLPMVGADVCGFFNEPDLEMCARWMQLGAFYPFSRNHNTMGTADQDPGVWPEVGEISREVLTLRYKYLPFLYTLFHHGATSRDVYFPQGLWYDLVYAKLVATGPTTQTVSAPLEIIPVFVRGGSILPYQVPALNTVESRKNPFGLTVAPDELMIAQGQIFWDDGEALQHAMSQSYMSRLAYYQDELTMSVKHGQDAVAGINLETIDILGFPKDAQSISVNGAEIPSSGWRYDADARLLSIYISVPLADDLNVKIYYDNDGL
ncbi:alpha glucosidase [Penaeus vannamei]|uniref:Alpha glucosidase n=1 Tax=Penaeus vannamei TaxID=6689 RepID=A0A423SJF6_PENVA|nr:alpha glucosidase [Penaeus vannamei]